jgi:hypothetical protein
MKLLHVSDGSLYRVIRAEGNNVAYLYNRQKQSYCIAVHVLQLGFPSCGKSLTALQLVLLQDWARKTYRTAKVPCCIAVRSLAVSFQLASSHTGNVLGCIAVSVFATSWQ